MTFSFSAFEMLSLVLLAERRNCIKMPHKVPNRKHDKNRTDFTIHLNGAMGEFAVAKLLNINIDDSISLGGDDKISDLVKNNTKIQVKTNLSRSNNPHLYFNHQDLFKADIAVLTTIKSANEVIIEGWITKEKFLNKAKTTNFGYGERIGLTANMLDIPETLLDYVDKKEEEFI
jgi:hypothetical protein